MKRNAITEIFFSPGGTTKEITDYFANCLLESYESGGDEAQGHASAYEKEPVLVDLLKEPQPGERGFGPGDFAVFSVPVFAGRIPKICPDMLSAFKGKDTPAVAIAVYGNREYEDALVELVDILEANGFLIIGAAAFLARHSMFPKVAEGRPDAEDKRLIRSFAEGCQKKLERGKEAFGLADGVKGNRPYKEPGSLSVPLIPTGDDTCTQCGICVSLCPAKAIDKEDPRKTDPEKCFSCTACIYHCPRGARAIRGSGYDAAREMFEAKMKARKEPEIFL